MAKRRGKGDGGLFQRHDHPTCPPIEVTGTDEKGKPIKARPDHACKGRWSGTVEIVDSAGVRQRKTVYGRTRAEAKVKQAQAMREKDDGTLTLTTTTVEKWLTYWLDNIAVRTCKPQTMRSYRSKVNRYLIPRLGRHRLTALRPEHIRGLHDWMREDLGLSELSTRHAHTILRKALQDAVHDEKLASNPAARVKAPATSSEDRTQFTMPQARAVLNAAGDDARWWLALFYGMRQGECLGLRWEDVDLPNAVIHIRQTLQVDEEYRIIFGEPKSKASRRDIPLVPMMEARLRLHWINEDRPTEGLVFTNNGAPFRPAKDWERWRALLDLATVPPTAPIPYVALHAARNTAASLMEAAGIPDRIIAQILGHTNVRITHGYQNAELARVRDALMDAQRFLELE